MGNSPRPSLHRSYDGLHGDGRWDQRRSRAPAMAVRVRDRSSMQLAEAVASGSVGGWVAGRGAMVMVQMDGRGKESGRAGDDDALSSMEQSAKPAASARQSTLGRWVVQALRLGWACATGKRPGFGGRDSRSCQDLLPPPVLLVDEQYD